jgi:hypothetical protein
MVLGKFMGKSWRRPTLRIRTTLMARSIRHDAGYSGPDGSDTELRSFCGTPASKTADITKTPLLASEERGRTFNTSSLSSERTKRERWSWRKKGRERSRRDTLDAEKDEKTSVLDQELHLRSEVRDV